MGHVTTGNTEVWTKKTHMKLLEMKTMLDGTTSILDTAEHIHKLEYTAIIFQIEMQRGNN